MKILILPAVLREQTSAAKAHLRGFVNNFPHEHKLVVIAQPNYAITETANVKVVVLPLRPIRRKAIPALFGTIHASFSIFRLALRACKREHIDAIYARHGGSSLPAAFLAKRFRLPLVLEVNGLLYEPDELGVWLRAPRWFIKLAGRGIQMLEAFSFRAASKLVVCTWGALANSIHEKYKVPYSKMLITDNGADTMLFHPTDQKLARQKLGLDNDCRWVIFTGSLRSWQGLDKLLEAAPLVLEILPDARFLIVGDGPQQFELVAQAQHLKLGNRVLFTGHVSYEEIPWYINAADLCVAPYFAPKRKDLGYSPLKLFEYMACGKAVVVSDLVGIGGYVKSNEAGKVVPAGDSVALAKTIISLLNDSESRHKMGQSGREAVLTHYSWEIITKCIAQECVGALPPLP